MNYIKSAEEIATMHEGGKKLGAILQELLKEATEGIALSEIESKAMSLIQLSGGTPSFQTVSGYKWATCLCVNDVVVHGIPTSYRLKKGDVLTIDIGLLYKGLHTDTAWTILIGDGADDEWESKKAFLKAGEQALKNACDVAKAGNRIGHISQAFQEIIEGAGYSVVRSLVGHGVGKELHEPPQVPGFVRGNIGDTLELKPGMTLALEIIYAQGKGAVEYANSDGWTISTQDGSLASVFEHSVAITEDKPVILTQAML